MMVISISKIELVYLQIEEVVYIRGEFVGIGFFKQVAIRCSYLVFSLNLCPPS